MPKTLSFAKRAGAGCPSESWSVATRGLERLSSEGDLAEDRERALVYVVFHHGGLHIGHKIEVRVHEVCKKGAKVHAVRGRNSALRRSIRRTSDSIRRVI